VDGNGVFGQNSPFFLVSPIDSIVKPIPIKATNKIVNIIVIVRGIQERGYTK